VLDASSRTTHHCSFEVVRWRVFIISYLRTCRIANEPRNYNDFQLEKQEIIRNQFRLHFVESRCYNWAVFLVGLGQPTYETLQSKVEVSETEDEFHDVVDTSLLGYGMRPKLPVPREVTCVKQEKLNQPKGKQVKA
jgi:hypothetical protein